MSLKRSRRERIAGRQFALREADGEPAFALFRRAVGKRVRYDASLRALLQRVVADRAGGLQRRIDVAGIEELFALLGMVGPYAGVAIGLQFDAHLDAVGGGLVAGGALRGLRLGQRAQQVLHVVADLVRDHIGLREFAGVAGATVKARFDLTKKRRVEIDAAVARAVERPHRRLREAAAALLRAGEQPQPRRAILLTARPEHFAPGVLGIAQHGCDELTHRVDRRAGAPAGRPVGLLVVRSAADAFRAADQHARIDAGRPADQPELDHGSNAEAAAPAGYTETTAAESATGAAIVLDILAAAEIIPTHSICLRKQQLRSLLKPSAASNVIHFATPLGLLKSRLNRQNLPSRRYCR